MSRGPASETDDEIRSGEEWRDDESGPADTEQSPAVEQLPIEPGSPQTENIVFVLLGVLLATSLIAITIFPTG
ncbi:hypothetical protein C440_15619 [Haloferax mucosum ATCC BAA-1512]|uniref:DUF7312 domain-containing protein n=1 Tax=Haloferax mucosum ATCC BAA-1512 TaxID=662479 RepID=M0I4R2_9EURY|nr:hypothetical protein [Haloferax mucosum]ELZ91756.1 hypothetical protein C440_15619 [Haloferax mucosum ATCC BAA-1512]